MILDEELHVAAVKTKIQTQLNAIGSSAHPVVYEIDGVPSPRPNDYVEVNAYRRFGGESRNDGYVGTCGWRIEAVVVSRNLSAARQLRKAVTDALLNQSLTVSSEATTGVLFENEDVIAEDDDYYVGATYFTYTI